MSMFALNLIHNHGVLLVNHHHVVLLHLADHVGRVKGVDLSVEVLIHILLNSLHHEQLNHPELVSRGGGVDIAAKVKQIIRTPTSTGAIFRFFLYFF